MSTKQVEKPDNSSTSPHLDEQVKQALHQVYRYLIERAWLRQSAQSNGDSADSDGTQPAQSAQSAAKDGKPGCKGEEEVSQ